MAMNVAVGQAYSVEGREAVSKAIYEARLALNNEPVSFAMIVASDDFNFNDVASAATTQLGDVPLIGLSTSGEITVQGSHRRSVVAALISDANLQVEAEWLPGFSGNSRMITDEMLLNLGVEDKQAGMLMIVPDGLSGGYDELLGRLPSGNYATVGCLPVGDLREERTFQMGGTKSGANGLAAAFLSGEHLRVGVGIGHGWQPVGANFKITHSRELWIRTLDGRPASDSYAALFGKQGRDWAFPPLNTLVRLYPLGVEREGLPLQVRTPLRVEPDGSLRMSAGLRDGLVGQLLVGSRAKCLEAARKATGDALRALEGAQPKMAFVFADVSWEMLFQGFAGAEVEAIREVLGRDVPIIGGYTFGQIAQPNGAPRPEFLNQHIEVIVLGEAR
jgi:hypothetical protein